MGEVRQRYLKRQGYLQALVLCALACGVLGVFWHFLPLIDTDHEGWTSATLPSSSSRSLLGSQKSPNDPILIGGVGTGLFSIIFIGAFSLIACVAFEGSENPTFIKICLFFMNGLVVFIIFILPKKKQGEPATTYQEGEFYSSWLWLNALIYGWFALGLVVCFIMIISNYWAVPIYALEDDRMARKG